MNENEAQPPASVSSRAIPQEVAIDNAAIRLCRPESQDGAAVFDLVSRCPPLDPNSMYCNLLQCTHFADTSIAAKQGTQVLGFVSGYILPDRPNTLFIWQVAVDDAARGQGLASRMLLALLTREACADITHIQTTITEDNRPSWQLFTALSQKLQAPLEHYPLFGRETHFAGVHDTEILVTIGAFQHNRRIEKN